MSIEKVRKSFHKLIDEIDDVETLKAFIKALEVETKQKKKDGWDALSQGEKNAINEGLEQLDRGEGRSYKEVRKAIKDKHGI